MKFLFGYAIRNASYIEWYRKSFLKLTIQMTFYVFSALAEYFNRSQKLAHRCEEKSATINIYIYVNRTKQSDCVKRNRAGTKLI